MKPIQVGLLGIGTVGSGTFNVLERNQDEIRRRAGRGIEITMVADLDTERAKSVVGDKAKVVGDRAVEFNGVTMSLTALAKQLSGKKYSVAGPRYFKYKGEWLNSIRERLGV